MNMLIAITSGSQTYSNSCLLYANQANGVAAAPIMMGINAHKWMDSQSQCSQRGQTAPTNWADRITRMGMLAPTRTSPRVREFVLLVTVTPFTCSQLEWA
jgi:hypothetical protein